MAEQWVVRNEFQKKEFIAFLTKFNITEPIRFEWKKAKGKRSLDANGLYWQWMGNLANHFSKNNNNFSKDMMHDLMRHKFLGYEDIQIGKTSIKGQLKSTAKMRKDEFSEYMLSVDLWAQEHGCMLPRPDDSQYESYQRAAQV